MASQRCHPGFCHPDREVRHNITEVGACKEAFHLMVTEKWKGIKMPAVNHNCMEHDYRTYPNQLSTAPHSRVSTASHIKSTSQRPRFKQLAYGGISYSSHHRQPMSRDRTVAIRMDFFCDLGSVEEEVP